MKKIISIAIIGFCVAFLFSLGMAQKKACAGNCQKKHFDTIDADKDGTISLEEWNAFHEKKFRAIDKNNDGFIDQNEFKSHQRDMMKERRGCAACPMK